MGIVGIDIGGTNFRIGLVNSEGDVLDFRKVPVKRVFATQDPLTDLTDYLKSYCDGKTVEAVAIGFPATLDVKRQAVLQAPNISFMENLPVVEVLTKKLGCPVCIERDVTFALAYDCQKNSIPDNGIACGFYFGTGVGNAISINGAPLIGKHGTAGELGHIPVDGNEQECGCGNTGCMETVAGGKYLAHLCRTVYTDTHITQIFLKHSNEPPLRQFVDRMSMAVAAEINILDPDHILIGGGVPAMEGFPKDYLLERIVYHTRKPLPAEDMNVLFTEDSETKSVIGAAIHCKKMLNI